MKRKISIIVLILVFTAPSILFAVEAAPRISDREIVERLSKLDERLNSVEKRIDDTNKRIDDTNKRIDDTNKRIDDLRAEMNSRFNTIERMFGIFITISLVILGFVLRMQWQMQKRMTRVEVTLETYRDELSFLKGLIEKLLPPKGIL